nr:hypothetical protein [uncultured Rhodopila sp.]
MPTPKSTVQYRMRQVRASGFGSQTGHATAPTAGVILIVILVGGPVIVQERIAAYFQAGSLQTAIGVAGTDARRWAESFGSKPEFRSYGK